ncbi:hypothetical protein PF011_g17372 [Phytophthora fragariae]|uniref:Uncharacterized protein n=1 Tax=Phytophthora fragariae TaxID=53985 RepID=A0A6A3JGL3_9STRA|nr:hypothetical protein PF011_g17372 [Phytophthora fragariae]
MSPGPRRGLTLTAIETQEKLAMRETQEPLEVLVALKVLATRKSLEVLLVLAAWKTQEPLEALESGDVRSRAVVVA